jgi:predicted nucleic acid-binding Zn ribbon protein
MNNDFKSLAQSIDILIDKLGFQQKVKEQKVIQEWTTIAGAQIGKIAKPEKIVDQVLYLRVANMSWRTELMFQKQTILKQIEIRIGKNIVKDLRFF